MKVVFDFVTTAKWRTRLFLLGLKQTVQRIYSFCLLWLFGVFTFTQSDQNKNTRRRISRKPTATVFWCIYIAIHGHRNFYTTQFLQQTTFTPGTLCTRNLLHQTPLTPNTFYTRQFLQQTIFTPGSLYKIATRHFLNQTPFTTDNFYNKQFLHQAPFTPGTLYIRNLLHETPFTADNCCNKNIFYTRHPLQFLH